MRRPWLQACLAVLLLGLLAPAAAGYRTFRYERDSFRRGPSPVRPEGLELVDVRLVLPSGEVCGWYLPARNRAAVVLAHGSEADRTSLLTEARLLASGGYGALLLDLPGSGESAGRATWGEPEVAAVRAAGAWLAGRPEVDPARIGLLGFSLGSAVAVQAAADDPRFRAVALLGAFPSYDAQLRAEFSRWGPVTGEAAVLGAEAAGARPSTLRPVDVVGRLAGRPLLFVTGSADRTVPPGLTEALFLAAPQPKTLWVAPNAVHGGYATSAREAYRATLLTFFDKSLPKP